MAIQYYKLFDLLNRRSIKRGELAKEAQISAPTMSRLSHNGSVSTDTLNLICAALNCQPGDIMEWVPEVKEEERDEHARK